MRGHQPVRGGRLEIDGAPAVAGQWRLDAAPRFTGTGAFAGYVGRLRRPSAGKAASPAATGAGDRMRQVLHELADLGGTDPAIFCCGPDEVRKTRLSELLPDAFGPGDLG